MLTCMRENLELERALDTFDLMKKQKIVPGLLTYLSIIDLAVNLRQPAIASELLQQAELLPTFRVKDQFLYMHVLRSASYEGQVSFLPTMCIIRVGNLKENLLVRNNKTKLGKSSIKT